MPRPTQPSEGRIAADVLDLLAEALLVRLEREQGERSAAAGPQETDHWSGPGWLRVSEVAERVGACERTVYRALRSGALAGERLGAHWRIRPDAVEAWLADPRPPRSGTIAAPERGADRPRPGAAPQQPTYLRRARALRASPTPTSRGSAARKEQR